MAPNSKREPARDAHPRPDRFATHRAFIEQRLKEIVAGPKGSPATAVIWFVLWNMASGLDGTVRGASVHGLADKTGLDRVTVRKAIKSLIDLEALTVVEDGRIPVYYLVHVTKDDG